MLHILKIIFDTGHYPVKSITLFLRCANIATVDKGIVGAYNPAESESNYRSMKEDCLMKVGS